MLTASLLRSKTPNLAMSALDMILNDLMVKLQSWSTPLLSLLPGPLKPGVVGPIASPQWVK